MARNQHGGDCYRCGLWVAPGTGHFEKRHRVRGWRVRHHDFTTKGGVTCEMAKRRAAAQIEAEQAIATANHGDGAA